MPLERPRLKAFLTVEVVDESRAFIVGEERAVMLERPIDVAVLPLLDGGRTLAEIVGELAGQYAMADIFRCVGKLEALDLLSDGRPDIADRELGYWDALGIDGGMLAKTLISSPVTLLGLGNVDTDSFAAALRAAGVEVEVSVDGPASGGLTLVLVDDYLEPGLAELNRAMLAGNDPWMLVKSSGVKAWLGPLLQPNVSGCWQCLAQRITENRQVERYLKGRRLDQEALLAAPPESPLAAQTVAGLLITDIVEILTTGSSSRLAGTLVTLDRQTLTTEAHVLIRQPQCPACGDPSLITARDPQVELVARQVRFSADGGYRTERPEETFDRLRKHISPILGAVTALVPVTESESGVTYSYAAGHNFALIGDNMPLLRRNLRGQSGGKGRTDIQARVSAVAEAIERYSGVWRGDEPVRRATYDELAGEHRLHIADVLLYSDQQYDTRAHFREQRGRYNIVPMRFRTDVACDWTTTWSLTHDRPTLVPSGHVWFGHPDIEDHFFTYGDGNGNASGSVREEAILQATLELVERDSVAIWWYNRLHRRSCDLDSLDDPYVETLRRYYRSLDREFWVLDITSDLGIPSYAAISRRLKGDDPEDVVLGFGAHVDPYLAVMRALTEMNQFLPAVTQRKADGSTLYLEDDPGALDWWHTVRVEEEPWLLPAEGPGVSIASHGGLVRDSLTEDLQGLLDLLAGAGLDVLLADQTRPDLDLSVVKVIVPGLRHFWRRLAPGRLYDVPVAMGWLSAPLSEEQLNPKSVFF